jgi:sortase (surface protein transpeptidase)
MNTTGRRRGRRRVPVAAGALLIAGGATAIAMATAAQQHAPQPSPAQYGTTGPAARQPGTAETRRGLLASPGMTHPAAPAIPTPAVQGPLMTPSAPVSIAIPAIGVHSKVFDVGLNPDGTIQVPPLDNSPLTNEAAWYRYSSTPGAQGTSIIEGHVDSAASGPSVFYRLGALAVGQQIYVTRQDRTLAVFRITAVRQYPKDQFPTSAVYGNARYAALRLVTCGGQFDSATHHYLSNTVVFAALASSRPAPGTVGG